jgi:hypothetical protein
VQFPKQVNRERISNNRDFLAGIRELLPSYQMVVLAFAMSALPANGNHQAVPACPKSADIVAKVENRMTPKSRESRFLDTSTAATLCSVDAKVRDRFCTKQ